MCNKSTGWGRGERGERVGGWEDHERGQKESEEKDERKEGEKERGWERCRPLPMLVMLKIEWGSKLKPTYHYSYSVLKRE